MLIRFINYMLYKMISSHVGLCFKGVGCFTRSGRRRGVDEMGANAFLEELVFGGISRELIQIDLVALERLRPT